MVIAWLPALAICVAEEEEEEEEEEGEEEQGKDGPCSMLSEALRSHPNV